MIVMKLADVTLKISYPFILILVGLIGMIASTILVVEEIHLLENPGASLACDINPIIACSSALSTEQGRVFGFPNPLIGVAAFASLLTIGASLLAGAKFKKWFWLGLQAGVTFGVVFVHWFIYQSIYNLGSLCPYCMLTWTIVIPLFWYTTLLNVREKRLVLPKSLAGLSKFAQKHHLKIIVTWILIIIGLITEHFWYYWKTLI